MDEKTHTLEIHLDSPNIPVRVCSTISRIAKSFRQDAIVTLKINGSVLDPRDISDLLNAEKKPTDNLVLAVKAPESESPKVSEILAKGEHDLAETISTLFSENPTSSGHPDKRNGKTIKENVTESFFV